MSQRDSYFTRRLNVTVIRSKDAFQNLGRASYEVAFDFQDLSLVLDKHASNMAAGLAAAAIHKARK